MGRINWNWLHCSCICYRMFGESVRLKTRRLFSTTPHPPLPCFHIVVNGRYSRWHLQQHVMSLLFSPIHYNSGSQPFWAPVPPFLSCWIQVPPSGLYTRVFYVIVGEALENSSSTSLQRVALRRVVSLSSGYFLQKPFPQKRMLGLMWSIIFW